MEEPENHTLHSQLIVDNPNEIWKSEKETRREARNIKVGKGKETKSFT